MKKLINDSANVVVEALQGLEAAHGDLLAVHYDPHYITRRGAPMEGKVGVLSGGGSGHEPLHGGFVGRGMLDAACPGATFTSPTPDQMLAATKAINGGQGVLHIVKNYTGDVMNFELAAELARDEGMEVESVIVNDDVAVKDSLYTAGRRGVGGTVLIEKIVGAAAEEGRPLTEVKVLSERTPHGWPLEVGMMIEVPAAALGVHAFVPHVDFFSIGTNDLTQYTLAAERGHPQLGEFADALHPAVLRLIARVARLAERSGKWVGVCGEAAADPVAAGVFVGLGVHELSVGAAPVGRVRAVVSGLDYQQDRRRARRCLKAASAKEVRHQWREVSLPPVSKGR